MPILLLICLGISIGISKRYLTWINLLDHEQDIFVRDVKVNEKRQEFDCVGLLSFVE